MKNSEQNTYIHTYIALFHATTLSYSMTKVAHLDDAFSEIFELKVSLVEGQSLYQKDKRRRKRKDEKNIKNENYG